MMLVCMVCGDTKPHVSDDMEHVASIARYPHDCAADGHSWWMLHADGTVSIHALAMLDYHLVVQDREWES